MSTNVRYDVTDSVAVLTIDRHERRNAVDRETGEQLRDALVRFDADAAAAVGVITGSGGTFCAGVDLHDLAAGASLEGRDTGFMGYSHLEVRKPLIAAVEGHCVAGGLELALFCDLRVAGDGAVFGLFQRRFGIPLTDGGTQRLPRIVGLGRALEMIHTGRAVDAEEAHDWGLVNRVVEDGTALEAAVEMASGITAFPQQTVRTDRRAVFEGLGESLRAGLAIESWWGTHSMETGREGAKRFVDGEGRHGDGVFEH
ncbi:enoyl-CoA hydratase [Salinigranum rubrum]|uniref:Enoyl-CoA hydratase n=1 Tax=Salinigranum rubrum TaxID=755307 RepID=A0A2I8VNI0_9EURY|nr:crotonase/enoyl-CoA hydratase family protein [Salinigranum rubrum]AUV83492.1 enoyl-CoA hydratase [Salinigranum rubrum]